MCQRTGKRPQSHLVLDYKQLSFRGGNGDGRGWGQAGGGAGCVQSHQDRDRVDGAESAGETEKGVNRDVCVCVCVCVRRRMSVKAGVKVSGQAFSIALWGRRGGDTPLPAKPEPEQLIPLGPSRDPVSLPVTELESARIGRGSGGN